MKLKFMKVDPEAIIPKYAHKGDACFDLHALINNTANYPQSLSDPDKLTFTVHHKTVDGKEQCSVTINPHCSVMFHTGLKCEIEPGHSMHIYVRSSIGIKSALTLSNGTGIIDAPYRGEIMVALTNNSDTPRTICNGDRVAQGAIIKNPEVEIEEVTELSETERGEGGIGSSGK